MTSNVVPPGNTSADGASLPNTDSRKGSSLQKAGPQDAPHTRPNPGTETERRDILFLRIKGFMDSDGHEDLNAIAHRFEKAVLRLSTKAEIVQKSFVHTTTTERASFCATVAIKTEMKSADLIENLKPWDCDCEFAGITPVFEPPDDADVDIIAVHGLLGHPIAAWKHTNQESQIWLSDWLPKAFEKDDIPRIRVLLCGYDTKQSNNSCPELGKFLLAAIREFRGRYNSKFDKRPIIFIAHSLGGLVLKEAMLAAIESEQKGDSDFLTAIYAILFFGVPNAGLRHEVLLSEVTGKPCDQLAKDLVVGEAQDPTPYLENLSASFGERFRSKNYKIDVFYEKRESKVYKIDKHGKRTDEYNMTRKVNKMSASMVGVTPGYCQPLDADHTGLVRYESEHQAPYIFVRDHLQLRVKEAPIAIAKRFRTGDWNEADNQKAEKILTCLHFSDMDLRQQAIPQAASQTYAWMLSGEVTPNEHGQTHPPCRLSEWLENGDGVFWVCGKAGSGKSTLMKFVRQHSRTLDLLRKWAAGSPLFVAEHHFWYPGSLLQKSYDGFFRTLLYRILKRDTPLMKRAFPSRWAPKQGMLEENLSQGDLRQALLDLGKSEIKICLFIDGLDELHPRTDHQELVRTISDLEKLHNVKLCVSSRQWQLFEKAFQSPNMLRLEDINRNDIEEYVEETIRNSIADQNGSSDDDDDDQHFNKPVTELISSIVNGSSGVFLWVHIVTQRVIERLRIGQDIKIVQEHVDKFPRELEDYFRDLIYKRISPTWQQDGTTAQALKLAMLLSDTEQPSLLIFWWFLVDSSRGFHEEQFGILNGFKVPTLSDLGRMHEVTRNFLTSACQDLLQIVGNTHVKGNEIASWFINTRVTFMHRTVFDFLSSEDMRGLINGAIPSHLQKDTFLIQLNLATAKLITPPTSWTAVRRHDREETFAFLTEVLSSVDTSIGFDLDPAMSEAVVEACEAIALKYLEYRKYWPVSRPRKSLPFWISNDDISLVHCFLRHGRSGYLTKIVKYRMDANYYNLLSSLGDGSHLLVPTSKDDFSIAKIDLEVVRLLLSQGLDPNYRSDHVEFEFLTSPPRLRRTAWATFLSKCFREAWNFSPQDAEHAWQVAKILLDHGASLTWLLCIRGDCGYHRGSCQPFEAVDVLRAVVGKEHYPELRKVVEEAGLEWPNTSQLQIKPGGSEPQLNFLLPIER